MRGADSKQEGMFSYVSPESRIPTNHPLRPIRKLESLYSQNGRPSIAPERLIRALLLQVLCTIRSERMLVEQLEYNLLFRWFVGLSVDEPVWDHSTFSKNRDRLFGADITRDLFDSIIGQVHAMGLLSDEHFSIDHTLIQSWASNREYTSHVPAMVRFYGGEYLAQGVKVVAIEGVQPPPDRRIEILIFPSETALHQCMDSPEYARYKKLRTGPADTESIAFDPI